MNQSPATLQPKALSFAWAPLYAIVRQGGGYDTSVHFTPTAVDIQPQTYVITLSLLDPQGAILWSEVRKITTQFKPERFCLQEALGLDTVFEGLLCIHPQCLTRPADPERAVFLECWVDIQSTHGSYLSFPAVPYRGESKQILAPEEKVIPGVVINSELTTRLLVINPTKRPVPWTLTLYNQTGATLKAEATVAPWGFCHQAIDAWIPQAADHLAGGIGAVRVASEVKTLLFFDFVQRSTGVCMGRDHAAPYFLRKHH